MVFPMTGFTDDEKRQLSYEYDRAADQLAKLSCFAHGAEALGGALIDRAERLAIDDLLYFSIHTRRLFELLDARKKAYSTYIPTCDFQMDNGNVIVEDNPSGDTSCISLAQIYNSAIHHKHFQIITSRAWVAVNVFGRNIFDSYMRAPRRAVSPVVLLKSHQEDVLRFQLRTFGQIVVSEIFEPLAEEIDESGAFVDTYNWEDFRFRSPK